MTIRTGLACQHQMHRMSCVAWKAFCLSAESLRARSSRVKSLTCSRSLVGPVPPYLVGGRTLSPTKTRPRCFSRILLLRYLVQVAPIPASQSPSKTTKGDAADAKMGAAAAPPAQSAGSLAPAAGEKYQWMPTLKESSPSRECVRRVRNDIRSLMK